MLIKNLNATFVESNGIDTVHDLEYDPKDLKALEDAGMLKRKPKKDPVTLRDVMVNSIIAPKQGDNEKKKWEKYEIWKVLRDAKPDESVRLTSEQIKIVKESIADQYFQLIMGQAYDLIENGNDPEDDLKIKAIKSGKK